MTSIEKLISWLENDLEKQFDYELERCNTLDSVLNETPGEISSVVSELKQNTSQPLGIVEKDFVLGYLTSFIFHKFILSCGLQGLDNSEKDLSIFLSNLISHAPRLRELINEVIGKQPK